MRDLEFTKNEKAELIYDVVAGIMAVIGFFKFFYRKRIILYTYNR